MECQSMTSGLVGSKIAMAENSSFDDLMARLRAGDEAAASQVFHQFGNRLIALARSRLGSLPRHKQDPEDVLQSVMKSFFLRQADGQFDLDDWDNLWSLLVQITVRKCGRRIRYFRRECRDVQRERPYGPAADDSGPDWEAAAAEPTPLEAATLAELVEHVMGQLNEGERRMLMLSLQGYSAAEISAEVGRSERTVFRLLQWVRELLQREDAGEEGGPAA